VTRRVRTLIVGSVLFVVLVVLAVTLPVPYVVLSPGPTYNTLGQDDNKQEIIVLKGRTAQATTGNLNMTTVDISGERVTVLQALIGWLQHDRTVVPRSAVYPPGQSQQQVNQQDTQQFAQSQDSAIVAASCQLGYPERVRVESVDTKLGANGKLKPGDMLVSVDGTSTPTNAALTKVLNGHKAGQTVTVVANRAGSNGVPEPVTVSVTLSPPAAKSTTPLLGIGEQMACEAPFSVDLGLGDQIGGPSAGLMFALGIMDKVGPTNLTGGRFIAGTGEIQPNGNVLPIGGIQLKMIAARRAGATVFLAPAANCADVRGSIPGGLDVVKVNALSDAVADLKALQQNKAVPHC
jgi:PDZ domain-containing protein